MEPSRRGNRHNDQHHRGNKEPKPRVARVVHGEYPPESFVHGKQAQNHINQLTCEIYQEVFTEAEEGSAENNRNLGENRIAAIQKEQRPQPLQTPANEDGYQCNPRNDARNGQRNVNFCQRHSGVSLPQPDPFFERNLKSFYHIAFECLIDRTPVDIGTNRNGRSTIRFGEMGRAEHTGKGQEQENTEKDFLRHCGSSYFRICDLIEPSRFGKSDWGKHSVSRFETAIRRLCPGRFRKLEDI